MVTDYYKAVDIAVRKYAKDKSDEEQRDIRQTAYLALVEAGSYVKNIKIAYGIAKNTVLQYMYRGEGKLVPQESLSDESVFRTVEKTRAVEFDISDGLDVDRIREAVKKLPSDEQFIIESAFGLGLGYWNTETVAEWLGKPVIWVERRKKLALLKLKKMLKI